MSTRITDRLSSRGSRKAATAASDRREGRLPRRAYDSRVLPVVSALESRGLLDPVRHDEAVEVVDRALAGQVFEAVGLRRRLAEVAGYVGGAFVVAAGAVFVADQWINLSVGQQVALLAGIAVLLAVAGVGLGVTGGGLAALRAGAQPVRRRLASVLFTGAAVAGAAAVVVRLAKLDEPVQEGARVGMGGSLTLLVLGLVGYYLAPTMLGQATIAVGAVYAVPFTMDTVAEVEIVPLGLAFLALGAAWLLLAEREVWREVVPARVIGSTLVLVGAQVPVGSDDAAWFAYLATFLVAVGGFAMYVALRAWPYLAVGVVGVTLAVPEALLDWTDGSLGTAGVLLVAGLTLLGASLLGLRLRQEVAEHAAGEQETGEQRGGGEHGAGVATPSGELGEPKR